MNESKVSIVFDNATQLKRYLINDILIAEGTKRTVHIIAEEKLKHICYTIVRKNVLPDNITIVTKEMLKNYVDNKDAPIEFNPELVTKIIEDFKTKNPENDFAFSQEFTKEDKILIRQ